MGIIEKRQEMIDVCEEYVKVIEGLKNQVYGYNVYLTHVAPFEKQEIVFEEDSDSLKSIDAFAGKICEYFKEFNNKVSNVSLSEFTKKDEECITSLIYLIIGFLVKNCKKNDYTFLGMIKILKTFLVRRSEEESKDKTLSTFYRMHGYKDFEQVESFPPILKTAFENVFDDYDGNYMYKIADGMWSCIRFYLYDNVLDYTSDKLMMMATSDMLLEISERLNNIQDNRKPRKHRLEGNSWWPKMNWLF